MNTVSFKEISLQEFDHEMATARKMLERVPLAEKKDWKPHEKSMLLGRLAKHVATLPGLVADIVEKDSLAFGAKGSGAGNEEPEDAAGLVALFDGKAKAARAALEGTTDEHLAGEWELVFDDGTNKRRIFKGPRALAYRTLFIDHFIHHRAQLGVYLRLNDVPIPGSFGPSADEPM